MALITNTSIHEGCHFATLEFVVLFEPRIKFTPVYTKTITDTEAEGTIPAFKYFSRFCFSNPDIVAKLVESEDGLLFIIHNILQNISK